jgi:hypothetical protein
MSQRDMMHARFPSLEPKYLPIAVRLDEAVEKTFQSIRELHFVVKSRCKGEEIYPDVLMNLLSASWAVENAQDAGHQFIINRDKKSYKIFMHTMESISSHVENLTKKCSQYSTIPFTLTAEAMLFGGDIKVLMRNYTQ